MDRDQILNVGYGMSLEFGKNWLQPINSRLKKKFKNLDDSKVEEYSTICTDARNQSNNFIYNRLRELTDNNEQTTEATLNDELTKWINSKYHWMTSDNISKTLKQGLYYAWKDGLSDCIN